MTENMTRLMTLEIGEEDGVEVRADDQRIPIALSSEYPVERVDWRTGKTFYEVLSHDASAVDMSRARHGLPFLYEHDGVEQLGLIEDIRLVGGKLRGYVRQGNNPKAEWVFADIRAGIRREISVGYRVNEYVEDGDRKGVPVRRYAWSPYEASSVSIPADPVGAGVGRSLGTTASATPLVVQVELTPPKGMEPKMSDQDNGAPVGADKRVADAGWVIAQGEKLKLDLPAIRAIVDSNLTEREAGERLMQHANEKFERDVAASKVAPVDLSQREQKRYSISKAILEMTDGKGKRSGFEFEVAEEFARKTGQVAKNGGLLIPNNIWGQLPDHAARTQLNVGTTDKGGYTEFDEFGGLIELARGRMVCYALGARLLPGLKGDLSFVRQSGASTLSWLAEDSNATASSPTFGIVTLSPKIAQAKVPFTRKLLAQSSIAVENFVRDDIATVHAIGIDTAAIAGTGSSQPTGLTGISSIGAVTMGAQGGTPTYAKLLEMEKTAADANTLTGNLAFLTTPGIGSRLRQTKDATENGVWLWQGPLPDANLVGYKAVSSTLVPSNLTKGTQTTICHAVIFGNWSELMIGEWGAMELYPDPYTSGPSVINMLSYQLVDVNVRKPASFVRMLDALQS
jgi:HK97 family phage major capsid protein